MKDDKDKVRNVEVAVKAKQSGSGPYIATKPIILNRHVNNIIVLVPANEREPQQVQVHVDSEVGGDNQLDVDGQQEHEVDRI